MLDQVPNTHSLEIPPFSCNRFYRDESGQDIVEYALLAAMVGLGSVAGTHNLASAVANKFTSIQTALANATPAVSGGGSGGSSSGSGGGSNGGGGSGSGGNGGGGGNGGRHGRGGNGGNGGNGPGRGGRGGGRGFHI